MKHYHSKDKHFHRAKQKGYRARSVFKLEEIQDRFKILKPGQRVLDRDQRVVHVERGPSGQPVLPGRG